jgi:hypothetical protein
LIFYFGSWTHVPYSSIFYKVGHNLNLSSFLLIV